MITIYFQYKDDLENRLGLRRTGLENYHITFGNLDNEEDPIEIFR